MQMAVIELGKNISYIEPTQNPLSANVVMIEGENNLWLYDVGNNPCVPQIISAFNTSNKKINVILSHFHADHIGNLDKISYSNVYQGRLTYKYTKTGEILENDLYFRDGNMNLHIFPLPSSHAKEMKNTVFWEMVFMQCKKVKKGFIMQEFLKKKLKF